MVEFQLENLEKAEAFDLSWSSAQVLCSQMGSYVLDLIRSKQGGRIFRSGNYYPQMLWYPILVDDMPRVREIWERNAQAHFKSFLEKIRKDSMQDADVSEFDASCINFPPSSMTRSVCQDLCKEWMNHKWEARAKSGRPNRVAIDVIHGGRSRSFSDHLVYMKREKSDATQIDVYKKMYTNKATGEFRGENPKRYVETYEAATQVCQQL